MNRLLITLLAILSASCEGILDGIYDEVPEVSSFNEGFHVSGIPNHLTLQLDATSYDEWIYVDLHTQTIERKPIPRTLTNTWDGKSGLTYQQLEGNQFTPLSFKPTDVQEEPISWDLAIHHFDVRTNGGRASCEGSAAQTDVWSDHQAIVDMKEMMAYRIGYQNTMINPVLSSWITMDISSPPPTYTASGKTYVLEMADGSKAQIKLISYFNDRGVKGYLTIDIVYPL